MFNVILSFFPFQVVFCAVRCGAACGVLLYWHQTYLVHLSPAQPSPDTITRIHAWWQQPSPAQPSPAIDHQPAAVFLIWAHECRHALHTAALQHCSHPNGINQHPAAAASILLHRAAISVGTRGRCSSTLTWPPYSHPAVMPPCPARAEEAAIRQSFNSINLS